MSGLAGAGLAPRLTCLRRRAEGRGFETGAVGPDEGNEEACGSYAADRRVGLDRRRNVSLY